MPRAWRRLSCSEDPDVKGTETPLPLHMPLGGRRCSEDPDVKGTETIVPAVVQILFHVAARIPM